MAKSNFQKIADFHAAFDMNTPKSMEDLLNLRRALIDEEHREVTEALEQLRLTPNDPQAQADTLKELVDVLYVVYGTIESLGWDADAAFEAVHASNMSKLDDDGKPVYREDGKVLKGPNYHKPDMRPLVAETSPISGV